MGIELFIFLPSCGSGASALNSSLSLSLIGYLIIQITMKASCSLVVVSVLSVLVVVFSVGVNGVPAHRERCPDCTTSTCLEPQKCIYGIVNDYCGRDTCARGPSQRCGGKWNSHGKCGDGLICSCQRCTGCSIKTLQCFSTTCINYWDSNTY